MNRKELEEQIKNMENELCKLRDKLANDFKNYETIIILAENIKLKDYNIIKSEFKNILTEIESVEELGIKKLVYNINNNENGFYLIYHWIGNKKTLEELEKYCRQENNIIKFLTVIINEDEKEE